MVVSWILQSVWNIATLISYQSYSQFDVIVLNDLLKLRTKHFMEFVMAFDQKNSSVHLYIPFMKRNPSI